MFFRSIHDVITLWVLVNMTLRYVHSFQTSTSHGIKRSVREETEILETYSKIIECQQQLLESSPGTFTYISGGNKQYCSLYIAAPINHVIELEFTYFDIDCKDNGALAILDGWELDFEIFPSIEDHQQPMDVRFLTFCGKTAPKDRFTTKQNVAQIQFIVPQLGQGFQVKVVFKVNYKLCNMVLLTNNYPKITLRNQGLAKNCTVLSLYPQRIRFLYVNIGETEKDPYFLKSTPGHGTGLRTQCQSRRGADSVQLYQGSGVSLRTMKLLLDFCGIRQTVAHRTIKLRCHSSALRLESSGDYFNVVKFSVLPAEDEDGSEC